MALAVAAGITSTLRMLARLAISSAATNPSECAIAQISALAVRNRDLPAVELLLAPQQTAPGLALPDFAMIRTGCS